MLLQELHSVRYFDVFEFNASEKYWACFVCNHPEKVQSFEQIQMVAARHTTKALRAFVTFFSFFWRDAQLCVDFPSHLWEESFW